MAKNPFAKSRKPDAPYAIYRAGDMTWHVLKTYKVAGNEAKDQYARWFVAAKSPMTFGSFELGDTYAVEVRRYGRLVAATLWQARCRDARVARGLWQRIRYRWHD
jgi:hypothetical protein